ncbi:MAG: hypothetical protein H2043_10980 [Rhizobiales bacterium]|nr:hypothetical protein [Hyphomicrobiales bacterium]
MIKCNLSMVPPGGGEQDYLLQFNLPTLPSVGDFLRIRRENSEDPGAEIFCVRGVFWDLSYPSSSSFAAPDEAGTVSDIWIECEFVRGPFMTKSHKEVCDMYEARGKKPKDLPDTMY